MKQPIVYSHWYADGPWQEALIDFLDVIQASEIADSQPIRIGLVGTPENRARLAETTSALCESRVLVVAEADEGWEQVTLDRLYAHASVEDGNFLYTHGKGVWAATQPLDETQRQDREPFNRAWRHSMFIDNISRWREAAELLEQGWDATGSHIIPEQYGGPYYGGNMWTATGRHIRTLGPVGNEHRFQAEGWIGSNPTARLYELRSGWPGWDTLATEAIG